MSIDFRFIKKNIWKILLILLVLILIYFINFNIKHKNALRIINADREIEKARLESGR